VWQGEEGFRALRPAKVRPLVQQHVDWTGVLSDHMFQSAFLSIAGTQELVVHHKAHYGLGFLDPGVAIQWEHNVERDAPFCFPIYG
jgi:hypothetical protein